MEEAAGFEALADRRNVDVAFGFGKFLCRALGLVDCGLGGAAANPEENFGFLGAVGDAVGVGKDVDGFVEEGVFLVLWEWMEYAFGRDELDRLADRLEDAFLLRIVGDH